MSAASETPTSPTEPSPTSNTEQRSRCLESIRRAVEHNPTESTPVILGRLLLDPSEYAPIVDSIRRNEGCSDGGSVTPTVVRRESQSNPQTSITGHQNTSDTSTVEKNPWNQQLAIPRRDTRLRRECVDDGRPVTWSQTIDAFEEYLRKQRDFAKADWCDLDHRFTRNWCVERYGEVCGVDKHLQDEFDDLHTVTLTLRGNQYNAESGFRCPVDHYDDLLTSNEKVSQRLSYHLDQPHARLTILGAHRQGYAHVHWCFWTEGRPSREPFVRALHAHIQNSPVALESEHDPEKAIRIERAEPDPRYNRSDNEPVTRLVREISNQLPWCERDILDADPHQQRFCAILWAKHYAKQWRTGGIYDEICDNVQDSYVESHAEALDSANESVNEFDPSFFADAENPTIEVEAGAWSSAIDPTPPV